MTGNRKGFFDRNKAVVAALMVPCVLAILGYGALQSKADQNARDIIKLDKRECDETKRSRNVDNARTGQMARIETRLEYIQRDLDKLTKSQEKVLDWLEKRGAEK